MTLRVVLLPAILVATLCPLSASPKTSSPRSADPSVLSCINPASGVHFSIPLNLTEKRAGSFPAFVAKRRIAWHDTLHGGYYSFDRYSGRLTIVFPSSTGGFSLSDSCMLVPSSDPSTRGAKR